MDADPSPLRATLRRHGVLRRYRRGAALFSEGTWASACSCTSWPRTISSASSCAGLTLDDLFEIAVRAGLHFTQASQTGVVFHMMSALSERGRVGLTAVGDTAEAADAAAPTTSLPETPALRAGAGGLAPGGRFGARAGAPPGLTGRFSASRGPASRS